MPRPRHPPHIVRALLGWLASLALATPAVAGPDPADVLCALVADHDVVHLWAEPPADPTPLVQACVAGIVVEPRWPAGAMPARQCWVAVTADGRHLALTPAGTCAVAEVHPAADRRAQNPVQPRTEWIAGGRVLHYLPLYETVRFLPMVGAGVARAFPVGAYTVARFAAVASAGVQPGVADAGCGECNRTGPLPDDARGLLVLTLLAELDHPYAALGLGGAVGPTPYGAITLPAVPTGHLRIGPRNVAWAHLRVLDGGGLAAVPPVVRLGPGFALRRVGGAPTPIGLDLWVSLDVGVGADLDVPLPDGRRIAVTVGASPQYGLPFILGLTWRTPRP